MPHRSPHNIFHESPAWQRLQEGLPNEIDNTGIRQMFHAYKDIVLVLTAYENQLLDRVAKLEDLVSALDHRLFDSEDGIMPKKADAQDVRNLNRTFLMALVSVATAAVMLGLNLALGE